MIIRFIAKIIYSPTTICVHATTRLLTRRAAMSVFMVHDGTNMSYALMSFFRLSPGNSSPPRKPLESIRFQVQRNFPRFQKLLLMAKCYSMGNEIQAKCKIEDFESHSSANLFSTKDGRYSNNLSNSRP